MKVAHVSGLGVVWGAYSPDVLDVPQKGTVGGGEAAMLSMAFGLQERGHEVAVFYPGEPAVYRGVDFRPVATAPIAAALGEFDCVVSWSDRRVLSLCPPDTLRIFSQQLNDLPYEKEFWENLDGLFSPAPSHLNYLLRFIPKEWSDLVRKATIPNGVNLDLFRDPVPFSERGHTVGYWSSPDRGLHHLFKIWPEVRRRVPDAELHVFYHLTKWAESGKNCFWVPDFCWRARAMVELLKHPPEGLVIHGPVNRWELAKWQKKIKVMAYPLDPLTWTEGFAISCLEAYAAGCRTVVHPDDSVEEVHGDAVEWVRGPILDSSYLPRFTDVVVEALLSTENPLATQGQQRAKELQWSHAVDKLDNFLKEFRC